MASTPRRSPRLDMKRTCLEAEMESPTIRKVRACFGEAEEQLFSPIQECLTLQASYYFVNGLTSNIFTVYTRYCVNNYNNTIYTLQLIFQYYIIYNYLFSITTDAAI